MSWTHPICAACWREREPSRGPVQVREAPVEQCAFCGKDTASGIYVRQDPRTVPRADE